MKFKSKPKLYKKCPRCGNRVLSSQTKCEECGLLFSRLEFTSNKAAKKKLRKFDRDFIIYTTQFPKDVSRIKLILLSLFVGLFGGHYFYVGKYFKGVLMILGMIYTFLCTLFNNYLADAMETQFLFVPIGIYAVGWIVSVVLILSGKFKVPVIVDMPELNADQATVVETIEADKVITEENEKIEKSEKKTSKTQKNVKKTEKIDKKDAK